MNRSTGPRASAGAWQRLQLWSSAVDNTELPSQLWAQASCSPAGLDVRFRLIWTPADATVMVPQQKARDSSGPERRDGLWQHTCFEAFAGLLGSDSYWEYNLSPSGDWNVYRFSGYRSGQAPELAYGQLPLTVIGPRAAPPVSDCRQGSPRALLELELCCPLPPPLQQRLQAGTAPALELGLSAVLEGREGELSYWALQHPGNEPDFHDRRGWLVRL